MRQRSSFRTLGKNFLSDSSSSSNDAAVDCQMSLDILQATAQSRRSDYDIPYLGNVGHDGRSAAWCFGESSSAAEQCRGVPNERKLEHSWRTTCSERRYEEQGHHSGVSGRPPTTAVPGLSSSSSQGTNGSFLLLNPSPSAEGLAQDLNLSAGFEDLEEEEEGFFFRSVGTPSEQPRRSSDSLNLLTDRRGFVIEEREDRGGCSLDARRMSYKRKAVEARTSHSSGIRGPGCSEGIETSQWHAQQSPPIAASMPPGREYDIVANNESESTNSRIRTGAGGAFSGNPSFLTASERGESSNNNLRHLSSDLNQQDPGSGNDSMTDVDVGIEASSSQHSSRLSLRNYLLDLNPSPGLGNGSHHVQSALQAPPLRGNNLPRWRSAASSRSINSFSSTSGGRNAAASAERTPRNVPISLSEHPMFLPVDEIDNMSELPVNWNSAGGNLCIGGHVGSTSGAGTSRRTTPLSSSGWPLRSGPRHHHRLSEMMRRSLLSSAGSGSGLPSSNHHALQASSSSSQDMVIAAASDNHRHRASSSRSWQSDVQADGALPYPLRTLAAAGEGRRSVMSEQIRHVLDLMRRGESLRFEDMMFLDHSVLLGMADIHDRHRDMRMDVDNMSYEELLALEERIGNVSTGLSEEAIAKRLKKRKYVLEAELNGDEAEKEPCCICREEYLAGEDVGELNCGHCFHTLCIKQWLLLKNLCPICKTAGLLDT